MREGQGRGGREDHCPRSQVLGPSEAQQDRTVVMVVMVRPCRVGSGSKSCLYLLQAT